jgi:hypothetical protein
MDQRGGTPPDARNRRPMFHLMATAGNPRIRFQDTTAGPWFRWQETDLAKRAIRFIENLLVAPRRVTTSAIR